MFLGPAGTGKFTSSLRSRDNADGKKIDRVILSRPAVEAGEKLDFFWRHERKSRSLFKTFV